MSRAFIKEPDGDAALQALPERIISSHPNLVTARGLRLIERKICELEAEREANRSLNDTATLARINRDLRYWQHRKSTAQLVTTEPAPTKVRLGVTVTLRYESVAERHFKLVGEDEANPREGFISWTSPIAQALLGLEVGDEVILQGMRAEIIGIAATAAE